MRQLAFKILAIVFTTIIATSLTASSLDDTKKDFKKTIKKEFNISKDGSVSIDNRYGEVNIIPDNGSEVVIEVTITVDKGSEDRAQEFFEKINIEFSNSNSRVSAETQMGNSSNSSSWTKWLNPKNWNSNNSDYSIDYEVRMPSTCKLSLSNKYGNISVGDLDNDAHITLKYGDGVMQDIKGDLTVDLGYGDLKIGEANDIDLDIKYGKFRCKSGQVIESDSKYSDIYIDNAKSLNADSGYDDYFIGDIDVITNDGGYDDFQIDYCDRFEFDSKYSDYTIRELGSGGSFDGDYGDIKVKQVLDLTSGFEVEGKYTDVWLGMDLPFNIDLDTKYTDVDLPSRINSSSNYSRVKDGNETKILAKSSSNSNNIIVDMKYGSFKIKGGRP